MGVGNKYTIKVISKDFVKGMPERRFFYTCEYLPRVLVNDVQRDYGPDATPTGTPDG